MKVRPREINIFNMSLIDILCGALGAFCFMMIVSLPYYKPPGSGGLREQQQATDDLFKDIDRLQSDLSDPHKVEELKKKLQELEAQVKQLQGQVNSYAAENEELKKKNDDLQAANDKKEKTLKQKKPFLVVATANLFSQDIDLYLQDDMISESSGKGVNGPLDPTKPHNFSNWSSDTMAYAPGHGLTAWVTTDAPADTHYKVFVKLANDADKRMPTEIRTSAFGDFGKSNNFTLPAVTLTPERYWSLLGTIVVDAENKLGFKEATPGEREAEWKELMKNLPAPTPVPSPSLSATAAPMTDEERRALREKFLREYEERHRQSPAPGASISAEDQRRLEIERLRKEREGQPTPNASDDQRRMEMERLRRERLQQSPAPKP
jgi:regulator of replication initiation timing